VIDNVNVSPSHLSGELLDCRVIRPTIDELLHDAALKARTAGFALELLLPGRYCFRTIYRSHGRSRSALHLALASKRGLKMKSNLSTVPSATARWHIFPTSNESTTLQFTALLHLVPDDNPYADGPRLWTGRE